MYSTLLHKQSSADGNSCGASLAVIFILRPVDQSALVYGHTLLNIKEENEELLALYRQSVAVFFIEDTATFSTANIRGKKHNTFTLIYFQTQDNRGVWKVVIGKLFLIRQGTKWKKIYFHSLKTLAYNLITQYQAPFLRYKDGEQKQVQYKMNVFASY